MPNTFPVLPLITALACAGCANEPLVVNNSLVTTVGNLALGSGTPQTHFVTSDYIRVIVYLSWPDVSQPGGTHSVDWNWYRGAQLVSQTHRGHIRFASSPADLWTQRAAAALGPGDYKVETLVDGQVMATNAFSIAALQTGEALPSVGCAAPADPAKPALALKPLTRGSPGPVYPTYAMSHGVAGCAVVRVAIDGRGKPASVGVVEEKPSGWGFGQSVAAMVATYRYPGDHAGWYGYVFVNFTSQDPPDAMPSQASVSGHT